MTSVVYKKVVRNNVEYLQPVKVKDLLQQTLGEKDLTVTPVKNILRQPTEDWGESDQALLKMIQSMKYDIKALQDRISKMYGLIYTVGSFVSTPNAAAPHTNEIELFGAKPGMLAFGEVCGTSTSARALGSVCKENKVSFIFDADPGENLVKFMLVHGFGETKKYTSYIPA